MSVCMVYIHVHFAIYSWECRLLCRWETETNVKSLPWLLSILFFETISHLTWNFLVLMESQANQLHESDCHHSQKTATKDEKCHTQLWTLWPYHQPYQLHSFSRERIIDIWKINFGYSDLTNLTFIPKGLIPGLDYVWMKNPPSTLWYFDNWTYEISRRKIYS